MITEKENKKRILTSYERLSEELRELFAQTYPLGYYNAVLPLTKPNGEQIYVVRLETPEVSYLVKVDVKVDDAGDLDEEETDNYDAENEPLEAADQFADDKEDDDSYGDD